MKYQVFLPFLVSLANFLLSLAMIIVAIPMMVTLCIAFVLQIKKESDFVGTRDLKVEQILKKMKNEELQVSL